MNDTDRTSAHPRPCAEDVEQLTALLDLMANFPSNEQRARYLLSSNWMRDRDCRLRAESPRCLAAASDDTAAYHRPPWMSAAQWQHVSADMTEQWLTLLERTARRASLCVCGKPAAHVDAPEESQEWACRVPQTT